MFADRYVIEECIGEGGMGRVYRARHQKLSRRFAVKVLFGDHATDPTMRERFAREAEAASRLDHPNVVSVLDHGETDEGLLYLVMDFVEGRELAHAIAAEGPFSPERASEVLLQLCHGLGHAHEQDLVHRDFKSENVILAEKGGKQIARIVDFGIAVIMESANAERLTTDGLVIGTPSYMSPEQATGLELDHRTDLFSLGVILYEMLAGVLPFEGRPLVIARQNLAAEPPPICERVPGLFVDPALESIALKLMEKRREDRFQTAGEVIAAVEQPAASQSVHLHEVALEEPREVGEASGKRSALWLVAAVAIVGLGSLAAIVGFSSRDDEEQAAVMNSSTAAEAAPVARDPPADAGAMTADPDAGSELFEIDLGPEPDPGPTKDLEPNNDHEREPVKKDSKRRAAKDPKRDSKTDPAPAGVTPGEFRRLYVSVGSSIETLAQRNPTAAAKLREQYFQIPYSDAMRTSAIRQESHLELRRLGRSSRRELDK